ncbi:MAG: dTDP-glucose pyrophosphorylase [Nitrospira sp.]
MIADDQMRSENNRRKEVVAVLPAAGRSLRLAPLPCSKELLPVGMKAMAGLRGARLKVVSHYLLECLQKAEIRNGYIVIRQGKWDIPAYWESGAMVGMNLAYVVTEGSSGPPDTIDRAYPFVRDNIVAFGFPDIILRPNDVFVKLLNRLDCSESDVVLALFPAHDTKVMDMIDIDAASRVRAIHLKPRATRLQYAWLCAVWTPVFTEFLHQFLRQVKQGRRTGVVGNRRIDAQGDIPVGVVLKEAVKAKLKVEGVTFPTGRYIDIGTPSALSMVRRFVSYSWPLPQT